MSSSHRDSGRMTNGDEQYPKKRDIYVKRAVHTHTHTRAQYYYLSLDICLTSIYRSRAEGRLEGGKKKLKNGKHLVSQFKIRKHTRV